MLSRSCDQQGHGAHGLDSARQGASLSACGKLEGAKQPVHSKAGQHDHRVQLCSSHALDEPVACWLWPPPQRKAGFTATPSGEAAACAFVPAASLLRA